MADTIHCFIEDELCEKCNSNPVQIIHKSGHTNNEFKKFCNPCFKKL